MQTYSLAEVREGTGWAPGVRFVVVQNTERCRCTRVAGDCERHASPCGRLPIRGLRVIGTGGEGLPDSEYPQRERMELELCWECAWAAVKYEGPFGRSLMWNGDED